MRISIREAFNFAFKAKNAWKTILLLFLFELLIQGVSFATQFAAEIPVVAIVVMCIVYPLFFVFTLVSSVYLLSFFFEIVENAKKSLLEVPEVFANFKQRMQRGLYFYLINFVYSLPLSMLTSGAVIALIIPIFLMGAHNSDETNTTLTSVVALLAVLGLALLLVGGIFTAFLTNAANYRLLASNYNLVEGYKFGEVWKIMKKGMTENVTLLLKNISLGFALVLGFVILFVPAILLLVFAQNATGSAGDVLMIASVILIAIVAIVALFASTIINYFVSPHLIGQMYRMWDAKGLGKV